VLDEAMENLRLLSLVTPGVLSRVDELADILAPEVAGALKQFAREEGEGATAMGLVRALKKDPSAEATLMRLGFGKSVAVERFGATMAAVKDVTQKRLSTTVEEENNQRDHFEEVCKREEKAGKERLSLEMQLKAERRERQKQLSQLVDAETRSKEELETIKAQAVTSAKKLEDEANMTAEDHKTIFSERETALLAEVEKLKAELVNIQKENREEEAALRKKKAKSEMEVSNWLQEYDKDMGTKEQALQDEKTVYAEVQKQLAEYTEQYQALRAEAEKAAEIKRKKQEEKEKEEAQQRKLDAAAASIQGAWRQHKSATEEAAAPKKAGKKGKKKK